MPPSDLSKRLLLISQNVVLRGCRLFNDMPGALMYLLCGFNRNGINLLLYVFSETTVTWYYLKNCQYDKTYARPNYEIDTVIFEQWVRAKKYCVHKLVNRPINIMHVNNIVIAYILFSSMLESLSIILIAFFYLSKSKLLYYSSSGQLKFVLKQRTVKWRMWPLHVQCLFYWLIQLCTINL